MQKIFIFIFSLILSISLAWADDAELYDPAPPADSAFVRVINASSEGGGAKAVIGGVGYGEVSYPSISSYHIVKGGEHKITIGDASKNITVDAGTYATIALTNSDKIKIIKDELLSNPSKARVYFYNFSDATIGAVYAPEHSADILGNVAPDEGLSREVNALKLKLQVKAGDTVAHEFADVQLKRRTGTSFLLVGKAGSYNALMVENVVGR